MELSEDEPLCSSDAECHCPKKSHKNDATNPFSNSTLLGSGRPGNFHGVINVPNDIYHTIYKPSSNAHYFTNSIRQNSQGLGNVAEHNQSPKPRNFGEKTHTTHVSGNQTSSTLSTTEPSENLGNNPLELLLLSLEARLEIAPGQDLFVHELARDLIQVMLHQFFISPEVESYTKGTDSGSVVIGKSLFAMTMFFKKKLSEKPKEWKQKFLPYTFGNKDNEARLLVATEVCQILKQERNVFKHKIMKNILVREGNPEQPITRLIELAKMIFEWVAPKGKSYSNKEIKEKFQDHFHNHEARWPEVDDQLEKLKNHTSRFRHA
ncbi:hypothetical protein BY996DRAFT_6409841 [Phakopsora pachyrhizi]|nr:hypothetical protein BY996DRAFT_6409841 [Phakopsora pachyrhizi]